MSPSSHTILHVGIDAHQDSLSISVLPEGQERPDRARKIANDPAKIRRLFTRLLEQGRVVAAYEAGCTGFVLWRQLTDLGVECLVPRPAGFRSCRESTARRTDWTRSGWRSSCAADS